MSQALGARILFHPLFVFNIVSLSLQILLLIFLSLLWLDAKVVILTFGVAWFFWRVGDFNEKMIAIHKAMGAKEDKEHATFRKSL